MAAKNLITKASSSKAVVVCALVLAATLFLGAPVASASADGGEVNGAEAFKLHLAMEVETAIDPTAPVHPVAVTVTDETGAPVTGAAVTYQFVGTNETYRIAQEAEVQAAEAPGATMALSGQASTGADGSADIQGIVRGCDYRVEVSKAGYRTYSNTHACKGLGSEQWAVVLAKTGGSGEGEGQDQGIPTTPIHVGTGSNFGLDSGSDKARPLPWLAITGDPLLPWLLATLGVALVGGVVVCGVLARRRPKGGADV